MRTFRSEFLKAITIRSTYVLILLSFIFVFLFNFLTGSQSHGSAGSPLGFDSHAYIQSIFASANLTATMMAIFAILLMAHEFRHNTIIYTLTASNSRTRVLASKFLLVLLLSALVSIPLGLFGLVSFILGTHVQHLVLPAQEINYFETLGRGMFYVVGLSLTGLLFATLIRNLVFSIAALFIIPGTVEGLIGLLLKNKNQYLPFTSLKQVVVDSGQLPKSIDFVQTDHPLRSAATFLIYLIVGWIVGWYLFSRRDVG
jgi:ABC-type transport system involved in multi-copper enzyme maturation permease subunit